MFRNPVVCVLLLSLSCCINYNMPAYLTICEFEHVSFCFIFSHDVCVSWLRHHQLLLLLLLLLYYGLLLYIRICFSIWICMVWISVYFILWLLFLLVLSTFIWKATCKIFKIMMNICRAFASRRQSLKWWFNLFCNKLSSICF